MIKRYIYSVIVITISFLAGFGLHQSGLIGARQQAIAPPSLATGVPRPYFELLDIDGNRRNIDEWRGSVIVLNFWATWCPPCLQEIPTFIELQDQYQESGLQFIGIALQEADEIRHYSETTDIRYPLLAGAKTIQVAQLYGNSNNILPYTVIIDRGGNIAFWKRGPLSKAAAEQAILPLL